MRYSCAFFDFDGTVADTKADVWESLEFAAECMEAKFPERFRSNPANLALSSAALYGCAVPALPEGGQQQFTQLVAEHYRHRNPFSHTALFPGIEKLLQRCVRERMPCYIVTNKPAEPLEKILNGKGWARYFCGWLCPDSIPDRTLTKPEMISRLLRKHSVQGKPILIGDTFSDIAAAKRCGIDSVGVLYGDGEAALVLREKPEFVVESPEEIENILFQKKERRTAKGASEF